MGADILSLNISIFRGSSAVEQLAVNQLVVGSIPTHGASKKTIFHNGLFCYLLSSSNPCYILNMQNNISVIIFDYGGVIELSDFDLINGIVEILGITKERWGDIYYTHNYLTNVEGRPWKEVALIVAEKLGATEDQLSTVSNLIEEVNSRNKVNTELIEVIRKLRGLGFKTAVISNYTSILRQKIADHGIYDAFDEIIISGEEGYQKPNAKLFEIAYKRLGVIGPETVFVDDSPSSLTSAGELGYAPILYKCNKDLREALSTLLNITL